MTDSRTKSTGLPDTIGGVPLTLRPIRLSDAERFSGYVTDMDVARMTRQFPRHFPLYSAEFRIMYMTSQKHRGLSYNYAITKTGDDGLIGAVELFRRSADDMFEIDYWIAKPFWGQGYATDAANMIIQAAKHHLGITRLKADVFADNPACLRVMEKLGFEKQGQVELSFSMARLEQTPSINLSLELTGERLSEPRSPLSKQAVK